MTLGDAVQILNKHKYEMPPGGLWTVRDNHAWLYGKELIPAIRSMTEFATIAIAEKLRRDAGNEMPATRKMMPILAWFAEIMEANGIGGETIWMHNPNGQLTLNDLLAAAKEWGYADEY